MEKITNEEKAKKYDNRKTTITSIGIGAMIGNAGFGIWDSTVNNFDCATPVVLIGLGALLVTGYAIVKQNPYKEVAEEKEEVKEEQPKVKKL